MTQLRLRTLTCAKLACLTGQLLRRILILLARRLVQFIIEADVDDLASATLITARLSRELTSSSTWTRKKHRVYAEIARLLLIDDLNCVLRGAIDIFLLLDHILTVISSIIRNADGTAVARTLMQDRTQNVHVDRLGDLLALLVLLTAVRWLTRVNLSDELVVGKLMAAGYSIVPQIRPNSLLRLLSVLNHLLILSLRYHLIRESGTNMHNLIRNTTLDTSMRTLNLERLLHDLVLLCVGRLVRSNHQRTRHWYVASDGVAASIVSALAHLLVLLDLVADSICLLRADCKIAQCLVLLLGNK